MMCLSVGVRMLMWKFTRNIARLIEIHAARLWISPLLLSHQVLFNDNFSVSLAEKCQYVILKTNHINEQGFDTCVFIRVIACTSVLEESFEKALVS